MMLLVMLIVCVGIFMMYRCGGVVFCSVIVVFWLCCSVICLMFVMVMLVIWFGWFCWMGCWVFLLMFCVVLYCIGDGLCVCIWLIVVWMVVGGCNFCLIWFLSNLVMLIVLCVGSLYCFCLC